MGNNGIEVCGLDVEHNQILVEPEQQILIWREPDEIDRFLDVLVVDLLHIERIPQLDLLIGSDGDNEAPGGVDVEIDEVGGVALDGVVQLAVLYAVDHQFPVRSRNKEVALAFEELVDRASGAADSALRGLLIEVVDPDELVLAAGEEVFS